MGYAYPIARTFARALSNPDFRLTPSGPYTNQKCIDGYCGVAELEGRTFRFSQSRSFQLSPLAEWVRYFNDQDHIFLDTTGIYYNEVGEPGLKVEGWGFEWPRPADGVVTRIWMQISTSLKQGPIDDFVIVAARMAKQFESDLRKMRGEI